MRFAGWYLKIAAGGAAIGAAMELFMIHTGFCASLNQSIIQPLPVSSFSSHEYRHQSKFGLLCAIHLVILSSSLVSLVHTELTTPVLLSVLLYATDEKVTVLESEKRAWESSPEAQAMREALNPWRKNDEQERR